MKFNVGERVLLYTGAGQMPVVVTAATRDAVTVQSRRTGKEFHLEGHDDVSRLSKGKGWK